MAAERVQTRAPLLGQVPTSAATKRSTNIASEARGDIGRGVKANAIVVLAVGETVRIGHGLKTRPGCVQFSAEGAPAPGVYCSDRTKRDVAITNDGPDPATVDVAIFS